MGRGGWDLFALILNQTNYERNYEGNVNTAMALLIKMVMVIKGFWQQLAFPPCILLLPNGFTFKLSRSRDKADGDDAIIDGDQHVVHFVQ